MYQNVILQLLESEDTAILSQDIETQNLATELKIMCNRPFMLILHVDHEILAVGRIKVNVFL